MADARLIGNKWQIVRLLGSGAMGRVYEVRHKQLPLRRALKELRTQFAEDPDIEKRFVDEARKGAALDHPDIVRVTDIDSDEEQGPFIVMDLVEGSTLAQHLQEGERFDYATVLRLGMDLSSALDCAHRQGVIHRDIKPANILLESQTGRPKLTDFGIAKQLGENADVSLTGTGFYLGTVRYSSREQLRNTKEVSIDGRADLYSLGVVLFEMLSGKRFLEGCSEFEIASRVGFDPGWVPELPFDDEPPETFRAVLEDCLAPEREDRIASATDLIARLEECRVGFDGTASPAEVATESAPFEIQASPAPAAQTDVTATVFSVERLQQLRAELSRDAAEYETLIGALNDLGKAPGELLGIDDISRALARTEEAEQRGGMADSQTGLVAIRKTLLEATRGIQDVLSEEIALRIATLEQRWQALSPAPAATQTAYQEQVEQLSRALAAQDWVSCTALLRRVGERVAERESAAISARPSELGAREPELPPISLVEELSAKDAPAKDVGRTRLITAAVVIGLAIALGAYFTMPDGLQPSMPPAAQEPAVSDMKADPAPRAGDLARYRDHMEVARFYRDRGEYAEAIAELDAALSIVPRDPEATELRDATIQSQKAEAAILGPR